MALSKESVKKAIYILNKVCPHNHGQISTSDVDYLVEPEYIILFDQKADGGYENVFIDIKNIVPVQVDLFNELKGNIKNTSFIKEKDYNITRIGWY